MTYGARASRRRHTRCLSDWSSNVCSSDLTDVREHLPLLAQERWYAHAKRGYARGWEPVQFVDRVQRFLTLLEWRPTEAIAEEVRVEPDPGRSEERRVGEGRR